MSTSDSDLAIALECADQAAALALSFFEPNIAVTIKADGSPVTAADRAVEHLVRDELARLAPDDAILGEEFGRVGASDRVWIIDPIDGTRQFMSHDPNWRVQIALEVAGSVQLGVMVSPALGLQWWSVRGGGAFESSWPSPGDTRRLSVSRTSSVDDAILVSLEPESRLQLPIAARPASWNPLPLVELVRGAIDAFLVERYDAWDHAPWIVLIEEAGGRFTDLLGGRSAHAGGGLYSNSTLHAELVQALGYPEPE